MNPVMVIPTYWSGKKYEEPTEVLSSYDHMTALNSEGELPRCLKSLIDVNGMCRIVVLVVSEVGIEDLAADRVRSIVADFPELDILVIGSREMALMHARLEELGLAEFRDAVMLSGYGSVRNVGFIVAAILGHTEVVFIDDDEIVTDKDFLIKALYGLGKLTKRGIPVLAKTGYFLDRRGSWEAHEQKHWYDIFWKQGAAFNKWIRQAMEGPRLTPANSACGGCMAIHYEAFKRVSFDPWIARGEDLDYLINMRMYGFDIWFDNTWSLRHLPPASPSEAFRFKQDIFRWIYEHRKIEYSRTQIDLLPIKASSLYPYPGPFLEPSIISRVYFTALLRSIARSEHKGYFHAATNAHKEASEYAERNCSRYFRFQYRWPELITNIENDEALKAAFLGDRPLKPRGITGFIPLIESAEVQAESSRRATNSAEDIVRRWSTPRTSRRSRTSRDSDTEE
ncbi:MAG: hypothetical protein HGA54_03300 [Actinobacteria bacterium]|nr:hypothetical protein [Actinomycetota bacterium]